MQPTRCINRPRALRRQLSEFRRTFPIRTSPDLRRHLPSTIRTLRGPHILLFHQHSDAEAAWRVESLEQVYVAYYLTLAVLGIELKTPLHRLPAMYFARGDDYRAYLKNEGAGVFIGTRGYHHPSRGLVLSYDSRSDPTFALAKQQRAEQIDRIDILANQARDLPESGNLLIDLPEQPSLFLDRLELRYGILPL